MNDPDYRGEKYEEFRETEKAMSKQEYPQAGPLYDKTTYLGRIRNKMDAADNEFAKVSCEYRFTVNELQEIIANWYSIVNTAIYKIDGGADIQEVRAYLNTMRGYYIKGG